MICPHCTEDRLHQEVTRAGVVIDVCRSCGGTWLDEGEIFFFTRDPEAIAKALHRGLIDPEKSNRRCPRCEAALEEGGLFGRDPRIDRCPTCRGLWFDGGELEQILEGQSRRGERSRAQVLEFEREYARDAYRKKDPRGGRDPSGEKDPRRERGEGAVSRSPPEESEVDSELEHRGRTRLSAIAAGMTPLPNLFFRSAGMLVLLYGLLGIALITAVEFGGLPPEAALLIGGGIVLLQFLLGPIVMDLSLSWVYAFSWVSPEDLPEHLRTFISRVTSERKMKFPRVGMIRDGTPNAFTYGHTPSNARLVITRGILDLLDEKEVEAVVGHEIGHARHWDMVLMTVANLAPLLLYFLYRSMARVSASSRKGRGRAQAVALGAYILYIIYIISQYVVLWFSRTRELHADRFAGEVTGDPNALSSALVKIAYGLASKKPASAKSGKGGGEVQALGAFGIFDARAATALAITAQSAPGKAPAEGMEKENVLGAMQWDLWNPWAKYHELHSTHPLVATRLGHLGEQAASLGQEPYVVFDRRKPESYWDEFILDSVVHLLPALAAAGGLLAAVVLGPGALPVQGWGGLLLLLLGGSLLFRTLFCYRSGIFPHLSISALLRVVKVSAVRPVPARIRGTIIGKGKPGLVWSEDFVVQDPTGILFLDYRQPWRIWELFFGLLRAGEYQGVEVEAVGWYRRAPVPYLELKSITTSDGRVRRAYVYHLKIASAAILVLAGLVLLGTVTFT